MVGVLGEGGVGVGGGHGRASPRPEFEGFGKGELSGGMDSCLRRNDGKGWVAGGGVVGGRGVLDSSRGLGMTEKGGGGS